MASPQTSISCCDVFVCLAALLFPLFSFGQNNESLSLDRPTLKVEREANQLLKVSFPSVAAQRYQLAFSSDFQRWNELDDWFDGTGEVIAVRVQKPSESAGFFRVTSAAGTPLSDQTKMIGVWRGGWPNEATPTYELVVTPDKITGKNLKDGTSLGEGTYKLDPTKKTIDATMTVNPGKGTIFLGIYSLEGDTFKWCSSNGTRKRPVEMAFKPALDHYLLILKRQN